MKAVTAPRRLVLSGYLLRRYTPADQGQVLALIKADQPQDQLLAPRLVVDALAGAPGNAHWRAQLANPRIDVLVTTANSGADVVGAISYAHWDGEFSGVLLWMHAREQPAPVRILLEHAITELRDCAHLYSCNLANSVVPGLQTSSSGHRPVTTAALRALGFTEVEDLRYRQCGIDAYIPELHYSQPGGQRTRPFRGTADEDGIPLARMLTAVENDGQKTFMINTDPPQTELTQQGLRMLCDALESIKEIEHP